MFSTIAYCVHSGFIMVCVTLVSEWDLEDDRSALSLLFVLPGHSDIVNVDLILQVE